MTDKISLKYSSSIMGGGIIAFIAPTIEYTIICTLVLLADVVSAYRLGRRVRKHKPEANDGKFKSSYAKRVFDSMLKIYSLIVLAHLIDERILVMFDTLYLANYVAAVFCFVEIWSILENESSMQDASWAKALQKIMVNKAERHFNVKLNEFKNDDNGDKSGDFEGSEAQG